MNDNILSLKGEWELSLNNFEKAVYSDICVLPGTLDENKKGTLNDEISTGRLSRKYKYTGSATYQKKVNIPQEWENKNITLFLERTKNTRVWVNDIEQCDFSSNNTLGMAQEYYLQGIVLGKENVITVEVTNDNYEIPLSNHMLTDETQTNWNGIIGKIELRANDKISIKNIKVYPDIDKGIANVKLTINKDIKGIYTGKISFVANSYNHAGGAASVPKMTKDILLPEGFGETIIDYVYEMSGDTKLWSEFEPALYKLSVEMNINDEYKSEYQTSFGMRKFSVDGTQFTINNKKIFMRGEANCAVFPIKGYPYMEKEEWMKFFKKAQSVGINFFRFHSWMPPKAAFEAADELGVYMQPELYGFADTPNFSGYFTIEAKLALDYLANHPSFVMFAWGNELRLNGNESSKNSANELRRICKDIDSTRLYAEGSNNDFFDAKLNTGDDFWTTCRVAGSEESDTIRLAFSWNDLPSGGYIESMPPNLVVNFKDAITSKKEFTKPIMNHEIGQFQTIPNFDKEIPKYDQGIFEARNLKYFRDITNSKGLLELNEVFAKSTARSSAIQYRMEIEAALRTPGFAGYQLLGVQDFPGQGTALVGMLDSFMDDKDGGFTPEEYKNFNDSVVVLAEIPTFIYKSSDTFNAKIILVNYGEHDYKNANCNWYIKNDQNKIVKQGIFENIYSPQGEITQLGTVNTGLENIAKAQKLIFEIKCEGKRNQYNIWVYPYEKTTTDILVADSYSNEVRQTLNNGGKVILIPSQKKLKNSVAVRWANDFWSDMFHKRNPKNAYTMGLYIDTEHNIFDDFPTEYFNDCQWYNLIKNSRAIVLDDAPKGLMHMVQNIDHMAYSRRLGSLFEAKVGEGSLIICSFDLLNLKDKYPEVNQMYNSIVKYAKSEKFNPKVEITHEFISSIIGLENIDIVSDNGKYQNPYENLNVLNNDKKHLKVTGECYNEQLTVDVKGRAEFEFYNVDFGIVGASKLLIGASAFTTDNVAKGVMIYSDKEIPFIFENGKGEKYKVESGTTSEFDFWLNEAVLSEKIKGIQNIKIIFDENTNMQLNTVIFKL